MADSSRVHRERLVVKGVVQGVGFRPYVYALATRHGLTGFIRNHSSGVTIEVEGHQAQLACFANSLEKETPPLARIDAVSITAITVQGSTTFEIVESESAENDSTPIVPDAATCDACLGEMNDPKNRRFRYPFVNCTNCGPRYTIVRDIPYDRPLTTMHSFAMCGKCQREYQDPADRRYHAQPNACPECGPTIWFVERNSLSPAAVSKPNGTIGEQAIAAFHDCIDADGIVAVKGIGGFHLACSADRCLAIGKLRERKARVEKPLAVMVSTIQEARRHVFVGEAEERLLCSPQRPIVPLRRRPESRLSEQIAPGNDTIGIMLPYSPLHRLLVERGPLVMTSGNISDEPIVRNNEEALDRLQSIADAFLFHNREIHAVCDDSVVRVFRGQELPIRRSRGYAPLPVRLNRKMPSVFAVGGELKATFCLTKQDYAYLSPHIGDMGNLETLAAFGRTAEHFQKLFRVKPKVIVCDLHPGYMSGQWARDYAQRNDLMLIEVQHHHAHITSVLAEQGADPKERVIGISFDGTGYGPDGAIWGGEVLVASCEAYQRVVHFQYVPLPGGDSAIRHPYRSALAHLWAAKLPWDERLPCVSHASAEERKLLQRQLERNFNCTQTSSVGRLFDAVAALLAIRQSVSYEAQAAMEMESMDDQEVVGEPYPYSLADGVIDTTTMLSAICTEIVNHTPRAVVISRFHETLCRIVVETCQMVRSREGLHAVALSGGVFQNVRLLGRTVDLLEAAEFQVLTHRTVPPNDGGLALGQAVVALQQRFGNE